MGIRAKMDIENRAKQFAPFDALTGFGEAIKQKEERSREELEKRIVPVINEKEQIKVPVIALFQSDGKIRPLYFSTNGIKIRVDHIKWEDQNKTWGSHYRCEITLSDRVEVVDLYYYNTERVWAMKRKE